MTVTLLNYFKKSTTPPKTDIRAVRPSSSSAAQTVLSTPAVFSMFSEFVDVAPFSLVSRNFRALVESCATLTLSNKATAEFAKDGNFRQRLSGRRLRSGWLVISEDQNVHEILGLFDEFSEIKISMHTTAAVARFSAALEISAPPVLQKIAALRLDKSEIPTLDFLLKFPNLRSLEILQCTSADFRKIECCAKLEYLAFQVNLDEHDKTYPLKGVFSRLAKLKELNVSDSNIGFLEFFGPMPELQSIIANRCKLEVLDDIDKQCPKLRKMDLVDSCTHDFYPLEGLKNFEEISIDREAVYRFPDLPLKRLTISDSLLHECDLKQFSVMKKTLERLEIGGCYFSKFEKKLPAIIKSFKKLKYLDISKIYGLGIGFMKNMEHLETARFGFFTADSREIKALQNKGVVCINSRKEGFLV